MSQNNITQHFAGNELFVKQLQQANIRYQRNGINIPFSFIGLDKIEIVKSIINVPYQLIGGYDSSFSKRLIIGQNVNPIDYIVCIKGTLEGKNSSIKHPDLLGAVCNIGLDIACFGDMWVEDNNFYLYVCKENVDYVLRNLTKVNKFLVSLEVLDYYKEQQFQFDSFQIISPSKRLDAIISDMCHLSRGKALELIKAELCNVNYKVVSKPDYQIKDNDVISVRNKGRYIVNLTDKVTKSNNIVVEVKKFK